MKKEIAGYLEKNKTKIIYFCLVILFTSFSTLLPYINLVFTRFMVLIINYLLFVYLFKISSKINIIVGILALLLSLPWLIVGDRMQVENLGTFAFITLCIAVFQESIKFRKDN